jgi:ribonuclease BN (tRNA processing enzyme)
VDARTIVLYHFSQTYRVSELVDAVAARVPAEMAGRVRLLLPEEGDRL